MGVIWILCASLLFSVMGVFVKLGSEWFSTGELVFYRSLLGFLGMSLVIVLRGGQIITPLWRWHLSRGVAGAIALLCFFYAIAHLSLGAAMSLNYTSPLFLALYLGLQQKRWPAPLLLLALALGFAGVLTILKPGFSGFTPIAVLAGVSSGALAGFAYLAVRTLGKLGEPPERIVWYFTVTSLLVAMLWLVPQGWHFPTSLQPWFVIAGLGGSATAAQFALTKAYQHGPTLVVGCFAYSTVLFSGLAEYLLWSSVSHPGLVLGQVLIVFSGLLAVWASSRDKVST